MEHIFEEYKSDSSLLLLKPKLLHQTIEFNQSSKILRSLQDIQYNRVIYFSNHDNETKFDDNNALILEE